MLWHPDKNQGDKLAEERFKKIAQAYSDITSGNVTSAAMPEFDFDTGESFSDLFDRYFSKTYSRPKTYTVEIPITLDEAFTGIDEKTKLKIIDALFAPENLWTVLDISHDAEVVMRSSKVYVLSNGVIVESASPADLAWRNESEFSRLFPDLAKQIRAFERRKTARDGGGN